MSNFYHSKYDYRLVLGDKQTISETLSHPDGSSPDLSGRSVEFVMRHIPSGAKVVSEAATIDDAAAGSVSFTLSSGQTGRAGLHHAEWILTGGSEDPTTLPVEEPVSVYVREDVEGGDSVTEPIPENRTVDTLYANAVGTASDPVGEGHYQSVDSQELSVSDDATLISEIHVGPTDDLAAEISANGGFTKYVVHGTHTISSASPLQISSDSVHIHLTDGAELKFADGSIAAGEENNNMIVVGDQSNPTIDGFYLTGMGHINGNRANNADVVNNSLIRLANIERPVIKDVTIRDVSSRVIYHNLGSDLRVTNCDIRNFGEGILWKTPNAKITNTDFIDSHLQDALEPLTGGDDFLIRGGSFKNIEQSAVDCFGGADGHIIGVKIENVKRQAIGAMNGSERITVDNVTIRNADTGQNNLGAVFFREVGCKISNSDIVADGSQTRGQKGISVEVEETTIDSCLVEGWYTNGISVDGVGSGTISETVVKNNNQADYGSGTGIRIGQNSPVNNFRILNSECHDDQTTKTQQYGIYLETGNSNIIKNNDVAGNASTNLKGSQTDGVIKDNIGDDITAT